MADINLAKESKTKNSSIKEFTLPDSIPEGTRNNTIFLYGGTLKRKGASADEIARAMTEANKTRCNPPMDQSEVDSIIRSVCSLRSGRPIGNGKSTNEPCVKVPASLSPTEQAAMQLEALFAGEEFITFVTDYRWSESDEKWRPASKGIGEPAFGIIRRLRDADSLSDVFPGLNPEAGIHFCVNPMNKLGERKKENVKAFRTALVEYDDIPKEEQVSRYLKSGLPIYSITDSGGKSVHALVRVDADNADEYASLVKRLYAYLEKEFGSAPDKQNKNPSRMSRLAGAQRGDSIQRLMYTEVHLEQSLRRFLDDWEARNAISGDKFRQDIIGDELINTRGACIVDGMPVILSSNMYQVGQEHVYRAVLDLRRDATAHQRKEVMEYLQLVAPKKNQADPRFIRFRNGVLDIETLELLPADAKHIVLNEVPHNWNPEARSELVDTTLHAISQGDPAIIANLWETLGLSMYRGHEVSRMILLQGSGANGKSTLLDMFKYVLGNDNCFSLSIQELGEKFQLVPTMGKLAIIGDDIASDSVSAKSCAVMKKFVTGEMVNDQYKGGATFQFAPYATLIYSCNVIPRFADSTHGFERRVHPIPLSARFSPGDEGYDPRLKRKLCTEECAEYAILKAVEALRGCLDRLMLTPNRLSDEMRNDILQENDCVLGFIGDMKRAAYDFVGKVTSDVYRKFVKWCGDAGIEPLGQGAFSRRLCSHEGLKSRGSNGVRRYVPKTA